MTSIASSAPMIHKLLTGQPARMTSATSTVAAPAASKPLSEMSGTEFTDVTWLDRGIFTFRSDASALNGVREVLVFADFNPIVRVLRFFPQEAPAQLGFRVKLQQSTPVRAAARTADGRWHVGGTWVNTVGGGCTAPSAAAASTEWQRRLNEVSGRQWTEGPNAGRLRLRIVHPMDTGLVAGTPAFHLEEINFTDAAGKRLMRVETFEPVSENPVFTLQRGALAGPVDARGRDNNGNLLKARIAP